MIFYINDNINNEKYIVNKICNLINTHIILINTKSKINNILEMLPYEFDNYADITNNNNLLILYNTSHIKVIFRFITNEFILFIIKNKLIIFINEINLKLIKIIKKIIKLINNNNILITNIILNINNNTINYYLSKITNNINIINNHI